MSFPIDQSPAGAFDMAGSISEWTLTRFNAAHEDRHHCGGSWATGDPAEFRVYGGNGLEPDRRSATIGFRLMMRRAEQ
jgi:formylglycine-generating enzyme required for sulfatase activity